MATFQDKLTDKREAYAKVFRIDDLNDANDATTLGIMLKTEIMIDDLQEQIQELMTDDAIGQANNIKKLHDLLRDASTMILAYQKTLAIDRKTRKTEDTASVADYIRALKRDAHEFMEQRIIKVWCPDCKVMTGRIFPVHDHTSFSCSFECSQCHKLIRARREARDILFDVKDAAWRRKYPAEVVQAKKARYVESDDDDGITLDGMEQEIDVELAPPIDALIVQDELLLGE